MIVGHHLRESPLALATQLGFGSPGSESRGLLAATVAGLIIAIEVGMFGFRESWGTPYVRTSLYEEIAGAVVLLIAARPLARGSRS